MDEDRETDADQSESNLIEELIFRCLESADPQATADQLETEHPVVAGRLRDAIARLATQGFVGDETHPIGSDLPIAAELPERLGQFRILSRLGAGGMGVVYLAEDEALGRQVAVKLVRPEQLYFPGARERFQREIEAIARLQHPGIVTIHSVGEEDGVPFFSMDYVRGLSLARLIANFTGLDPSRLRVRDFDVQLTDSGGVQTDSSADASWNRRVIHLVRDVAEALNHAHEQGVVHRDVKPSNILVGEDRRPRLLDFGLARTEDAQQITRTTSQLGSLPYMAPEQVAGGANPQEPSLDVYALGVTMYELLTLRSPFLGKTAEETRANILAAAPQAPRATNSTVSVELETVCLTAMDAAPVRRYGSMRAFISDLDNLLEHRPIIARPMAPWLRGWRWCQRHPTLAVLGVAVGLLFALSVGFAVHFFRSNRLSEANNYYLGLTAASSQLSAGRMREAVTNLDLCPERLRGFEWHHLKLRTRAHDATYRGHTDRVADVAVHPNGDEFVSVSSGGELRLWRVDKEDPTGRVDLGGGKQSLYRCTYSPGGGRILACGGDATVWSFYPQGGTKTAYCEAPSGRVSSLAVSSERPTVALGFGAGRVGIASWPGGVVEGIEMSPTGDDMKNPFLERSTQALVFSEDGRWLYAAQRNRIAIIDVKTRQQVGVLRHEPKDLVTCLDLLPGGNLLVSSGSFGATILWDLATREIRRRTVNMSSGASDVRYEPETQRILVGRVRGPITVYDARLNYLHVLLGHESTVTSLAVVPGQRLALSGAYDHTIRRWSVDSPPVLSVVGQHEGAVRTVAVTPDGEQAVSGGKDGVLRAWSLAGGPHRTLLKIPGGEIESVRLAPGSRRLLVAGPSTYLLEVTAADEAPGTVRDLESPAPVDFVAWHRGGSRGAAVSRNGRLYMVDADEARITATVDLNCQVSCVLGSPWSDQLIIGTQSGKLLVGDFTGGEFVSHEGHRWPVRALGADIANKVIASADLRGVISFRDPSTMRRSAPDVAWHDEVISSISFAPTGGRMITSTMLRQIAIWERSTMRRLTVLTGHMDGILDACFTPDGRSLLSVSMDGTLRIWRSTQ